MKAGSPGEQIPRAPERGLRRRLARLLAAAGLVIALLVGFAALSLSDVVRARHALVDRAEPAAIAARDLRAALVDQETGVQGFVLSRQPNFLTPYTSGRAAQSRFAAEIARRGSAYDEFPTLLRNIDRRVADWQGFIAEPAIQKVRNGDPVDAADLLLDGKPVFDLVRLALDDLEAALRIHESEARQQIDVATIRMSTGIGSTLLIVFLLFLLVWRSLRKQVIEPLERLGADAREVSGGDLSHRIEGTGPPDFLALAGDIEAMRARILAQLATVEEAGRQLDARNQDLARSNIELEQFAYVASHDLQEPLRKVASFCQLLQRRYEGQLDDRADQYIGFAVDGAKRMQALINDLLAFSRVGRTTRAFRPIALAEVVDAALVNLAVTVESAGGTVEVGDLPVVLGDPILLTAVFQNLIGNSMKFRGEDPPVVSIEAEASGDGWLVSVEDDGIGIEPRFAERVFVIFQRLHAREEFEGTGIGLALCRKIVEHHGGRIWIDGENPVGTRVMFTLPVNPP